MAKGHSVFQTPTQSFELSEEKGTLRLRLSKQGFQYYLFRLLWIVLISLLAIGASVILFWPLTPFMRALLILAAVGTLGPAVAWWLMMRKQDVFFDRSTDRLLVGGRVIGRLSEITALRLHKQGQHGRPRNEALHCLSIVFKTGHRRTVATLAPPAVELPHLAASIGSRLELPVSPFAESEKEYGIADREFRKWEWGSYLLLLTLCALTGFAWWAGLRVIGSWTSERFAHADFVLTPDSVIWGLPALFMGIVSAGLLIDVLYRGILKSRYPDWLAYQKSRYGFDVLTLSKWVYIIILITSVISVGLILDWYAVFEKENIVINRFFALSEDRYFYGDIQEIKTAPRLIAPNGQQVIRREYVLRFSDGSVWSTNGTPSDLQPNEKRTLIGFVEAQSGSPVQEVELLQYEEVY